MIYFIFNNYHPPPPRVGRESPFSLLSSSWELPSRKDINSGHTLLCKARKTSIFISQLTLRTFWVDLGLPAFFPCYTHTQSLSLR